MINKIYFLTFILAACTVQSRFLQQTINFGSKSPREILNVLNSYSVNDISATLATMALNNDDRLPPLLVLMSAYKIRVEAAAGLNDNLKALMQGSYEVIVKLCLGVEEQQYDSSVSQVGWCIADDPTVKRDDISNFVTLQTPSPEIIANTQRWLLRFVDGPVPYFTIENNPFSDDRKCLEAHRYWDGDKRNGWSTYLHTNACSYGANKWKIVPTDSGASYNLILAMDENKYDGVDQTGYVICSHRYQTSDKLSNTKTKLIAHQPSIQDSKFVMTRDD